MTRVVVGGASSGLGLAIAEGFAASGAELLLWARNRDRLEETAERLRVEHPAATVHVAAADASCPAAAEQIAGAATALMGGADVLILNAGGPPPCPPDRTDAQGWRSALQLLTVTPIDLATRLLPGMRAQGWGRVVAVLSSGVREPLPELAYSNGARSALTAWLKTISATVASDGVTVNGVLPGRIDTARVAALDAGRAEREGRSVAEVRAASAAAIPAGRYGEPREFAAVALFLASEAGSYVTGSFLSCDGGQARGTW
ncbi:SDR family oxidoreductase [Nakamurella sp. PAMC28650]|uniref:SDR family oxidoreductase n=1 Tax=Nakamurella sp. PAMC28650 TaxID=2762325 RepID=UPI00164E8C5C|nr:SDR family oxidoreductase [Nakamurella sp. PAMC28650]QNK82150.1 SDR family oxidoreductase [Nakamurella sp. PAMC28650]